MLEGTSKIDSSLGEPPVRELPTVAGAVDIAIEPMENRIELTDEEFQELTNEIQQTYNNSLTSTHLFNSLCDLFNNFITTKKFEGASGINIIKGRDFQILASSEEQNTPIVAINQFGELQLFENRDAFEKMKILATATMENPLCEYQRSKIVEGFEAKKGEYQHKLANNANVPNDKQEKWIAAHTDKLSGLRGRSGFNMALEWILKGNNFSMYLVDGDFFKARNQNEGPESGDDVIRVMSQGIQDSEIVMRLGGEEFLVLANQPNDLEKEIKAYNERMKENIPQTLSDTPRFCGTEKEIKTKKRLFEGCSGRELYKRIVEAKKRILLQDNTIGSITAVGMDIDVPKLKDDFPDALARDIFLRLFLELNYALEQMKNSGERDTVKTITQRSPQNEQREQAGEIGSDNEKRIADRRAMMKNYITAKIDRGFIGGTKRIKQDDREPLKRQLRDNMYEASAVILKNKEERKWRELIKKKRGLKNFYEGLRLESKFKKEGDEYYISPQEIEEITVFIESSNNNDSEWKEAILNKFGTKLNLDGNTLDELCEEYLDYASEHDANLEILNSDAYEKLSEDEPFCRGMELKLDPLQFKCFNEVLNHISADRILDLNVENLYETAEQFGFEVLAVKEIATLKVRLPNNLGAERIQEFEEALQKGFYKKINKFCDDIGKGTPIRPQDYINEWIDKNRTAQEKIDEPPFTLRITQIPTPN